MVQRDDDRERVTLSLSADEALVLLEWLLRESESERLSFEDQAEQRVLWDVEAMLEAQVVEVLQPDYDARLARARARVRDASD